MRTDGEYDRRVPASSARVWAVPPEGRDHFARRPVARASGIFRRRMCARNGSLHAPRSLLPSESAAAVLPSRGNYRPGPQRCGWYAPGIPSGRCSPVNHLGRGPSHVGSGGPKDNPRSARLCHPAFSCDLWAASPRGCQTHVGRSTGNASDSRCRNARLVMRLRIRLPE